MSRFRKILGVGLVFGLVLAVTVPVLADSYLYYIPIKVTETGGSSKTGLPILVDFNNQTLVSLGYLGSSGLDTRMQEAGDDRGYSVVDSKLGLLVPSITAYQSKEFVYYTGYSPDNSDFDIVVGSGGYITVSDHPDLDMVADFIVEIRGYFDTSSAVSESIMYREDSFVIYVQAEGSIRAAILGGGDSEDLAITATGITSGVRRVKVVADGTDFTISVYDEDDNLISSATESLGANSVPDSGNAYLFMQNDVLLYVEFIKLRVPE